MIRTIRVKEPALFKSNEIKEYKNILSAHFSQPVKQRSQSKFPINNLQNKLKSILPDLLKKTNNKCAYCESELNLSSATIDHFRPHYVAADRNGKISSEHYWWLTFNWNNLIPACQECNTTKKNYFPTYRQRATVRYSGKETLYNKEYPVFIDPDFENPETYFYYDRKGNILTETERGQITIDLLGLNRTELVRSRKLVAVELDYTLEELKTIGMFNSNDKSKQDELKGILHRLEANFNSSEIPYLGMRRSFIRLYLNEIIKSGSFKLIISNSLKRNLYTKLRKDEQYRNDLVKVNNFEIKSINIKNYKSIDDISINFKRTEKGNAGWAILIGENGVGKSSTLSATLKTLIGRNYRNFGFKIEEKNRNNIDENSSIQITFKNVIMAKVDIGKRVKYFHPKDYFINSSILGFGPFKHSNINNLNYRKFKEGSFVDNFFNPAVPLHSSLQFILRLTLEQFEYVAIAILDLLMLENKARIHRKLETEEVWFQYNNSGVKHFFNQLSDGYQSVITLGCNIIEGLLLNNESIENASGFVVIDEIGANLHPRWKMQIVKRLRRTFPNVQFLVTTHDPLCLKGIEEGETFVLKSNDGELEVLNDLPNPSEFRADQLLTSEFFGLYSTVDPEMEASFNEYYNLLYKPIETLTVQERDRLEELKQELRDKNHLGNTLREELLYVAIDEIIAKHKKSKEVFSRTEVVKEVKEKAIELIDEFLSDFEE